MGRKYRACLIVALLAGMLLSCSESPSSFVSGTAVRLEVPLQAASGLEQLVENVTLRIFAHDMDTITRRLQVSQGRVSTTVNVPPGRNRVFEMSAEDADSNVIYFGADTVSIGEGLGQEINIVLRPVVLLMRISPMYQEVEVGTSATVDIHVFNVDSLFGAAFTLIYDPTSVRIDGWSVGGFLGAGDGVLFGGHLEGDSLAIWYTRLADSYSTGVSGEIGHLAIVTLTPLVSGAADLSLSVHSDAALGKPDQSPVDRMEELVLDGATIVGRGVE
jgi:hypothetical protein